MKLINHLKDTEYPFTHITCVRDISRGVIINKEGKVAILKTVTNDMFVRDCYELPGGGVNEGESFIDAFKREAIEETGYEVNNIQEIGDVIDYYNLIERENHNHYFLGFATRHLGRKLEEYEKSMIQDLLFVSIDEAIDLFDHKMFGPVGVLIRQRELPILKIAKEMLKEYKNPLE